MLCPPSREHELTTANSGLILHLIFSAYTQISNYGPATRHWLLKERPSDIQQPSRRCRSCRRRSYPELGWERRDRARLEREIGRQKKVSFFRSRCFFLQPSQANLLPLFLHLNRLRDSTLLSLALTSRSAFSKWHPYLLQSVTLTIQSLRSVYRLLQREPAFGAQIRLLEVKNSNFELGNKGDFPLGSCGRIYLLRLEESQIKPKLSW